MIVIVEGIDRVGKTTLVNMLRDKLGFKVFKKERIGGNSYLDSDESNYGNALGIVDVFNSEWFDEDVVVDRFHLTEAVYSTLDRHSNNSVALMGYVEEQMCKCRNKYILIFVQPTDVNRSSEEHGRDLTKHNNMFDSLYAYCNLDKICVNYETLEYAVGYVWGKCHEGE